MVLDDIDMHHRDVTARLKGMSVALRGLTMGGPTSVGNTGIASLEARTGCSPTLAPCRHGSAFPINLRCSAPLRIVTPVLQPFHASTRISAKSRCATTPTMPHTILLPSISASLPTNLDQFFEHVGGQLLSAKLICCN